MKKIALFFVFGLVCVAAMNAQINVDANGHVGIGTNLGYYNSPLSVGGVGDAEAEVSILTGNRYGLYSNNQSPTSSWTYGVYGQSLVTTRKHIGVYGIAYNSTPLSTGRTYGIVGFAGNATSGWNSAVFGGLGGSQNGGAIVGSVLNPWGLEHAMPGRYAGYFEGPVRSTDAMTATAFTVVSDARCKTNVQTLGEARSLRGLLELSPVEYTMTAEPVTDPNVLDTLAQPMAACVKAVDEERHRFGLIAQDVQKIYPELVYEDANGYLSIDYIGLIPLLIQSVQQLNAELKTLHAETEIQKSPSGMERTTLIAEATLGQNYPNPFAGECKIVYDLPESVKVARLYIYDLSGRQVDSYVLNERGKGSLTIGSEKMDNGIYLYTLIADGISVGARQMIVR